MSALGHARGLSLQRPRAHLRYRGGLFLNMLTLATKNGWVGLRQVIRDKAPEDARRLLRYSRRLPGAVAQLVCFEPASRKRIFLGRYKASWRTERPPTFDIFAVADIKISALVTNHSPGRHQVFLRDSPLYTFVTSYQSGCTEGQQLYRTYLQETYGYRDTELRSRIKTFENLIKSCATENASFTVAARLKSDGSAFLIDGAHRAAIVCALGSSDKIRALIAL